MKGLIRNNMYNVQSSLLFCIVFGLIAIGLALYSSIHYPQNSAILTGIIAGVFGGFGALSGTTIQKDHMSQWDKFELTMPISRNDVIKAKYLTFLIYATFGLILTSILFVTLILFIDKLDMERIGFAFTFGFTFALGMPTYLVPLILKFGSNKNEILLIISVFIYMIVFAGSSYLFTVLFKEVQNINIIYRSFFILTSIILYVVSFYLSKYLYVKKEF